MRGNLIGSENVMAMRTQTETYRGYGKTAELTSQTSVECRFGGEVETVLAAHASAALSGAEAGNGEVRYFGKVFFSVVYEDAEKRVCRAEKGMEFTARAQDERCYPALTARAALTVENLSVRREGASVYVSALLGADISLYGETTCEYLSGGDLICRREPIGVFCAHLCGGALETEDEFETELIGDILLHAETANVTQISCTAGVLIAEGEVSLNLLALRGENVPVSFERLIPFRAEIPCDAAAIGCSGEARVSVGRVSLRAEPDEDRGKCRIAAQLSLSVEGCVYEEVTLDAVTDAFSSANALTLSFGTLRSESVGEPVCLTERIAGKAALSAPVDFSDTLQAVTLQRAEANLVQTESGKRVEGIATATLLVLGADGAHRGVEMSLPFSVPVQFSGECRVSVMACGMSARQKQEGEIDAEATLKIAVREVKRRECRFVSSAEEGDALPVSDSAVSVYIPCAGDGLWELSKRLGKSPEEVEANNPDLQFPVKEGQRIIIYRKKTVRG